jgi:hypothetical protein
LLRAAHLLLLLRPISDADNERSVKKGIQTIVSTYTCEVKPLLKIDAKSVAVCVVKNESHDQHILRSYSCDYDCRTCPHQNPLSHTCAAILARNSAAALVAPPPLPLPLLAESDGGGGGDCSDEDEEAEEAEDGAEGRSVSGGGGGR